MISKKLFYICMFTLFAVMLGCMFWIYSTNHNKINNLQSQVDNLYNYKLNQPALKVQVDDLIKARDELEVERDYYKGKYMSDEPYIEILESRYLRCESYANIAEVILRANGINFTRISQEKTIIGE